MTHQPVGRSRARRILIAGGISGAAVGLLAACGTRLPDSAFVAAQHGAVGANSYGSSSAIGSNSAGPGGTGSGSGGGISGGIGPGGTTTGGGGGSAVAGPGGSSRSGTRGGSTGGKANFASAPGVTASTITIGNISSRTNPFDPRAFVGPLYGLEAYVRYVNSHGGIHGRQLVLKTCDDQGSGDQDVSCVQQMIQQKVFALVSQAILTYQGASQVNKAGIPDIGSEPIDTAYDEYPHLWDLYGETYPRNGHEIGQNGKLYGGTEVYRYFKVHEKNVALKAGVVDYNQADSERFGASIVNGLKHEGYQVVEKTVNFALPDFDSVAIAFKNAGVKYVYDTIDRAGNVRLCQALDDNNVPFFAKVVTTQSWEQSVNSDYSGERSCANRLWSYGNTRNYEDTQYPEVAAFRRQMSADGTGGADQLSEWSIDGWAGAQWFADAASSCGADLTRACVEKYMNRNVLYDGHGLLIPRKFQELKAQPKIIRNCINMVHWSVAKNTWVTETPDMDHNCYNVPNLPYSP